MYRKYCGTSHGTGGIDRIGGSAKPAVRKKVMDKGVMKNVIVLHVSERNMKEIIQDFRPWNVTKYQYGF